MFSEAADITFIFVVGFIVWAVAWAVGRAAGGHGAGHGVGVVGRAWLVLLVWLVVSALPTLSGLLSADGPIPMPVMLFAVLTVASIFGFSRLGGAIASAVPLHFLVGFHGFRLPLELVLHEWVEAGTAPAQMTWTGDNIDVVAGTLALVFVPVVRRFERAAWIPSVIGAVLLLNVLRVVMFSVPGPLQRYPEAITLAFRFPHVWIATVCVAGAVAGHIVAFRALIALERRRGAEAIANRGSV